MINGFMVIFTTLFLVGFMGVCVYILIDQIYGLIKDIKEHNL